jgi:hypothetical protein
MSVGLEDVDYFVEASHTEMHLLWVTTVDRPHPQSGPIDWKEINTGFREMVGTTYVEFWFARIYGRLVAFYSPTSMSVDWDEVNKYVDTFCKIKDGCKMKCNAMNFNHCIAATKKWQT